LLLNKYLLLFISLSIQFGNFWIYPHIVIEIYYYVVHNSHILKRHAVMFMEVKLIHKK